MATVHECETALASLAGRLALVDADQRARYAVERTVACSVPDLGVVFLGKVDETGLTELRQHDEPAGAQVRLEAQSDDLIALTEGRLSVPAAWASGRLKIEASVLDLLKLRSLL